MVCGKCIPDLPNAEVACSPGGAFGGDIDLNALLLATRTENTDARVETLEDVIKLTANKIQHLPVETMDLPSMSYFDNFIAEVSDLKNEKELTQHQMKFAKKEELITQLVNAMSKRRLDIHPCARPSVRPLGHQRKQNLMGGFVLNRLGP